MHKKLWNKDFILLLQGSTVSTIGDLMYSVAIGYWVYQKTGSSTLMGIMSSISMFVTMFLSPFCGSIVDKCNRRWVIVGIDTIQGILLLGIGVLAYQNALSVPIVLAAALLASFCGVFYAPAISTLMLDIIPRDDMVRGQSIHSSISSMISLVGTAFSGAMVAFFGVPLIVVINGLSNLYAAVSELFVHIPKSVQQGVPVTVKGILRDFGKAVKDIVSDQFLRLFVFSALILNLLGAGPMSLMLPFCMEKGFTVDVYGYLVSAQAAASLLCAIILGIVKLKPAVRYWALAIGFIGAIPFFVLSYFSNSAIVMGVFLFIGCFMNCAGNTIFNASLMLALPNENRGAILGFLQAASTGGCALSALVFGMLGDAFPLYLVFAAGSILSLFPMLYMCLHPNTKSFVSNN